MDFEWSNHTGPVDSRSPFLAASQPGSKRESSFAPETRECEHVQQLTPDPGPHSVLDSPSKNGFATPSRPDNRSAFFSNKPLPSTPASSIPAHIQTWEPRTPASTYDFSSGGETPNTPQVDSDAGTPDTQLAGKMGRLGNGDASSPKKAGRRDSWMAFKGFFSGSPSPSKERDRPESRRPVSKKADSRIVKRRPERSERSRSKKRHALHREDDGDDSDVDVSGVGNTKKQKGKVQQTFASSLGIFFTWVEAHPGLPAVLSYWMQMVVNTFLGATFIYMVYSVWAGIMIDVDIESSKHRAEVMVEISACALEYNRNRCRPDDVVPAMEKACGIWETCMNRDPQKVARASVTAKTFAMIFNSFVEEFSYKSMVCIFLGVTEAVRLGLAIARYRLQLAYTKRTTSHTPTPPTPQTPTSS